MTAGYHAIAKLSPVNVISHHLARELSRLSRSACEMASASDLGGCVDKTAFTRALRFAIN